MEEREAIETIRYWVEFTDVECAKATVDAFRGVPATDSSSSLRPRVSVRRK